MDEKRIPMVAIILLTSVAVICAGIFICTDLYNSAGERSEVNPCYGLIYDGTEQDLVIVEETDKAIAFSMDGFNFSPEIPTARDAGEYTVWYRISGTEGWDVTEGKYTIAIAKKVASVTAPNLEITYGDEEPLIVAEQDGVVPGDVIRYTISREPGVDAGTYAIHIDGDPDCTNYDVVYSDGTLKISRKEVTVSGGYVSKMYGTKDPELKISVEGLIGSDTIQYEYSRETGEEVGGYIIVVSGETIQGNYVVKYVNGMLYIYQKAVTVRANDASKVYGDSDPKLTATVSDNADIKYSIYRESGESKGTYKIIVTGERLQGDYYVTYENATFSIMETASSWSTVPTAINSNFDGYSHQLIAAGTAVGGTAYYRLSTGTYSTSIPVASESGTYTVYYMVKGDYNHADTKESSLTVTIAPYVWNGTDVKEPKKVDGKYQIYMASELAWISSNNSSKNGFDNVTIELMHDIDLAGKEWTPIGTSVSPFKGTFNGNGYTISSMVITSNSSYVGLFGYTAGGSIRDLSINGGSVYGNEYVACLAGWLGSVTSNVHASHTTVYGNRFVGGIAGYQNDTISDSSVEFMTITCERTDDSVPYVISYMGNDAGGIVGLADADILRCNASNITVNAYRDVGGIVGNVQENVSSLYIKNCSVTYTVIIVNIDGGNIGKIAGRVSDSTIQSENTSDKVSLLYVSSLDEDPTDTPTVVENTTLDYIIMKANGDVIFCENSVETVRSDLHMIDLNNITITAPEGRPGIDIEAGFSANIKISGTVTIVGGKDADGIRVPVGSEVVISGSGTLKVYGNAGHEYSSLTGYTTDYPEYNGTGGSGIGCQGVKSTDAKAGTIKITGLGGLYAYGYGDRAYGIGGDGAMVIIENTYVYEVSGGFVQPLFKTDTSYGKTDAEGGPAIGGSIVKIMSNTTIKRADGGSKAAAIGTRFWTAGSSITIDNSALLDIRGGNASAGIGGSRPIDAGSSTTVAETIDISINNSKITVVGGYYGAGIGSGYDTHCGTSGYCDLTIRIMGFSDITATGGVQAASIGTGFHSAVLKGGIEDTVVFDAADGTDYKSGATYSLLAQSVGYGVVDSSREAKGLLDSNGVPVQVDFTIGGAVITNPFDPDRLAAIEAGH